MIDTDIDIHWLLIGWAVTFGIAKRGLGGLRPRPVPPLAIPNVTAHPSTANVPTSYYAMWHYDYLCTLKGQNI